MYTQGNRIIDPGDRFVKGRGEGGAEIPTKQACSPWAAIDPGITLDQFFRHHGFSNFSNDRPNLCN
jgi:hypothetical protein